MNLENALLRRVSVVACVLALIVSASGCGSGSKAAAAAALAERRQAHETKVRQERTQERNALKDYNSGS